MLAVGVGSARTRMGRAGRSPPADAGEKAWLAGARGGWQKQRTHRAPPVPRQDGELGTWGPGSPPTSTVRGGEDRPCHAQTLPACPWEAARGRWEERARGPLGGAGPGVPPQWGGHECEGMCQAGGHSVSETLRNTILMKSAL